MLSSWAARISRQKVKLFLIPVVSLWLWALSWSLYLDSAQRTQRLKSEPHIAETLGFYIQHRHGRPLQTILETLRQDAGYTSLRLCYRGEARWQAGESVESCEPEISGTLLGKEVWQASIPGQPGFMVQADTRVMSLTSSLVFLLLALSFMAGILLLVQLWHKHFKLPQGVERSA